MRELSVAIIEAKNQQSSPDPWLTLIDVEISDNLIVHYVANTSDITYNGTLYRAFGYKLSSAKQDTRGGLNEVTITVSNITREVSQYVLNYELRGRRVIVTGINYGLLSAPDVVFVERYKINNISGDEKTVTFTLGNPPLMLQMFPGSIMARNDCRFTYGDRSCQVVNGLTGPGTVNWDAGTGKIVGTNTKFTSNFIPGDTITVNGQALIVQLVTSYQHIIPVSPPTTSLPWLNQSYAFSKPTCSNTRGGPNGCAAHLNSQHFGGFWGVDR